MSNNKLEASQDRENKSFLFRKEEIRMEKQKSKSCERVRAEREREGCNDKRARKTEGVRAKGKRMRERKHSAGNSSQLP